MSGGLTLCWIIILFFLIHLKSILSIIPFLEPAGTQSMLLSGYTGEDDRGESSSILSELPKLLMGRKKKYSMKKKQGIFGLF